jgi:hypothetical protein
MAIPPGYSNNSSSEGQQDSRSGKANVNTDWHSSRTSWRQQKEAGEN